MTPQPKRRLSRGRRDRRRANAYRMELPELTHCPQCGEAVLPYHVCPKCGTYRRAQVLDLKEKSKKEK